MKRLKPQKSHIILVILVALFIQLLGPGAQADTLRLYYGSEPSENFMQAHPGVEIDQLYILIMSAITVIPTK